MTKTENIARELVGILKYGNSIKIAAIEVDGDVGLLLTGWKARLPTFGDEERARAMLREINDAVTPIIKKHAKEAA